MAMFNNPYNSNFYLQDLQGMRDRIDRTIQQYQHQQPAPITQNFQIAPNTINELDAKYVSNIDDVKNIFVVKTGIFTTKDYSMIWIKDASGNIKTYKTEEIIELDEKDKKIQEQGATIEFLKREIDELKGEIKNATINADVVEQSTTKKSARLSDNSKSSK